jgi:SM-20-related protein
MNGLWEDGDVRDAAWFDHAGFYVHRGFLDSASCELLLREMDDAPNVTAMVAKRNIAAVLDEHTRRSCCTIVGDEMQDMVAKRLVDIAPDVSEYFGVPVSIAEAPNFLVYRQGDFFAAHRDASDQDCMPEYIRRRRLGVILFLNRQTARPEVGAFCGGTLGFYRLHTRDGQEVVQTGIRAEAGTLIAFPSHVVHEVRPVLHGRRYSIVTFYSTAQDIES